MGIIIGEKGKSSLFGGVYAGKKSVRKMLWEKAWIKTNPLKLLVHQKIIKYIYSSSSYSSSNDRAIMTLHRRR